MPYFPDDIKIAFQFTHTLMQFAAENVRQFVCNIHTKRIDIVFFHPRFAHVQQIFPYFGIVRIELGHAVRKCKRIIIAVPRFTAAGEIEIIDDIPRCVFRFVAVFKHVLPCKKIRARMIENAVEHNADAAFVRFRYEALHIVIRTERFVYPQVIGRIVFMLRRRAVDGIEIQTGYAEPRKVIELVGNTLQITAVSLFIRYRFVGRRPFAIRICIGFAAPAKARRKNLVPHRIFRPFGRRTDIGFVHPRKYKYERKSLLFQIRLRKKTVFDKAQRLPAVVEFKIILTSFEFGLYRERPPQVIGQLTYVRHFRAFSDPIPRTSHEAAVKRIAPNKRYAPNIFSGAYVYRKRIFIKRITVIVKRTVFNCGKVHDRSCKNCMPFRRRTKMRASARRKRYCR